MYLSVKNPLRMRSLIMDWLWKSCCLALICILFPSQLFATTYAYVPDYEANSILVIRTSDNAIIKTIEVGNGPFGVAVSPTGEYAYVTNREDGTVSVINTTKNEVTDTVKVGKNPMGIAVGYSGYYLYVANFSDNTVSIITTSGDEDNSLLTTIAVGSEPYGVVADPGFVYIYVTNSGGNTVTVFSYDKDPIAVQVGNGPWGIATDKEGEYVYVANKSDNTVSVINIQGENRDKDDEDVYDDDNQVVKTMQVGKSPCGVTVVNNTNLVYITNYSGNSVSVIDVSTLSLSTTLSVGAKPMGVANPLNGDFAYVIHEDGNFISVISSTNNTVSTFTVSETAALTGLGNFIGGMAPDQPLSLTADDISDNKIDLTWKDYSYNELGFILERRVYDSSDEDKYEYEVIAVLGANVTTYTDSELSSGKSYEYRVKAYNEAADSAYSSAYVVRTDEDSSTSCFISAVWN
jgi:YVTN family beta-propeller protein